MTLSLRPSVVRFLLAGLGMAVGLASGYIAMGLAVRSALAKPDSWLMVHLGKKRLYRLAISYDRAAAGLLPGDRDGDGVCDGRELYRGTDPRNSRDHPPIHVIQDRGGILVEPFDHLNPIRVANYAIPIYFSIAVEPGRRFHWHGRVSLGGPGEETFPRDFQLRILPPPGGAVGPTDGTLAAEGATIPVALDGSFAFDAQIAERAPPNLKLPPWMEIPSGRPLFVIENAATMESLGAFGVERIPALAPMPVLVLQSIERDSDERECLLIFPEYPSWPGPFVLQAARLEEGAAWIPVTKLSKIPDMLEVRQSSTDEFSRTRAGPLKFQVVPVE